MIKWYGKVVWEIVVSKYIRVILTFEVPVAVAPLGKTYCPKLILTNIT